MKQDGYYAEWVSNINDVKTICMFAKYMVNVRRAMDELGISGFKYKGKFILLRHKDLPRDLFHISLPIEVDIVIANVIVNKVHSNNK